MQDYSAMLGGTPTPMRTALSPTERRLQAQLQEFIERLSRDVRPHADASDAAVRARYDACRNSVDAFGATYLPHYWTAESAPFHADLDAILLGQAQATDETHIHLLHGPREHAKSIRARAALMLQLLTGARHYPLLISEHLYLAQAHLDYVFADLTGNRRITSDYEIDVLTMDRSEGVMRLRVTPRATRKAHLVQLDACSYGRPVKGRVFMQYRPDWALLDDFESTRTARSNEQLNKEKAEWVLQEVYPAVAAGSPVIWLGNTGSDVGALYQAMRHALGGEEPLRAFLQTGTRPGEIAADAGLIDASEIGLPGVTPERPPNLPSDGRDPQGAPLVDGALPEATRTASDGSDDPFGGEVGDEPDDEPRAGITAYCYRAERLVVTPTGEVATEYLWPQRYPPAWYGRKRRTMGPFLYESEENGCPIREGEFFKREWLDGCLWDELPEEADVWFSWLDPAFGESGKGAYKAIVVACTDGHAYYVVDAYVRNDEPVWKAFLSWGHFFERYPQLRHGKYENDFGQDTRLARDIEDAEKVLGFPLPVSGDSNQRGNKLARIESLEPLASTGRIRFPRRRTPDVETLFNQVLAYPSALDGPDALESCLSRLRRGAAMDLEYTSLGSRRYQRAGRRHTRRR